MPRTKYAHGRYILIDRELRSKRYVKTLDLKNKIEEDTGLTITTRQIENDLEAMKSDSFLGYNAPIKYDTKNKAYFYTDKNFTITKFNLKEEEILALKFHAAALNQYRDFGLFKDFSNALKKVVEAVSIRSLITGSIDSRLIVQTDNNEDMKGIEFLSEVANGIDKRKKLVFSYKKFEDEAASQRKFSPYLLKEHKNRWYIIGKLDSEDFIRTFALDRISVLNVIEENFEPDPSFDAIEYYKYSFGITAPEGKIVRLVLFFSPQESSYVKTLKIHPSQKIISDTKKGLKISIEVKPCYELYEYILGKGNELKVLSPKGISKHIAALHISSANT